MTLVDRRYSVAEGIAVKAPCRAATTANITLSGEQAIDGVAIVEGDRVLVKNQSTGSQNGIYDASTGNWTRARDFDGAFDIVTGTRIFVTAGSANGGAEFVVTTTGTITIDTTSIAFSSIIATATASAAAAAASASAASTQASAAAASAVAAAASAIAATPPPIPYSAGMVNGTIVESRAGNAITFTIKTLAGATPSSTDKVRFLFRNVTEATGDYSLVELTSALSITISAGSTLGFSNSTPSRLWIVAVNNAGTPELAVLNCLFGGTITFPLGGWGITSTTAEGGGGAADSSYVPYSATARTAKPYVTLGYAAWESGLGTAGTWNAAPTRIQLYGPGVPLPGVEIQRRRSSTAAVATGMTVVPYDDTIPQNTEGDQYMTIGITATSACNLISVKAQGVFANTAVCEIIGAIFRDSGTDAIAAAMFYQGVVSTPLTVLVDHLVLAATTASSTFNLRAGGHLAGTTTFNGGAGARKMGGVMNSFMEVCEIMT